MSNATQTKSNFPKMAAADPEWLKKSDYQRMMETVESQKIRVISRTPSFLTLERRCFDIGAFEAVLVGSSDSEAVYDVSGVRGLYAPPETIRIVERGKKHVWFEVEEIVSNQGYYITWPDHYYTQYRAEQAIQQKTGRG